MPIISTDIKFFKSNQGGTGTTGSRGGTITATEITDAVIENLFDNVPGSESSPGRTEYRCMYIKNNHGSLTLTAPVVWIDSQIAGGAAVEIGLDPAGVGDGTSTGVATTIADEISAPAGVTFSVPTTKGTGLSVANMPFGEAQAVWIKRIVSAATEELSGDGATIKIEGETPP